MYHRCSNMKVLGRQTLPSRGRSAGRTKAVTEQCSNDADEMFLVMIDGKLRAVGFCRFHLKKGGI